MEDPQIAKRIVEKGILAAKARVAAKRAREVTQEIWQISNLPGKQQTVLRTTQLKPNSSSSKETQLVDQLNLVVTVNSKLSLANSW